MASQAPVSVQAAPHLVTIQTEPVQQGQFITTQNGDGKEQTWFIKVKRDGQNIGGSLNTETWEKVKALTAALLQPLNDKTITATFSAAGVCQNHNQYFYRDFAAQKADLPQKYHTILNKEFPDVQEVKLQAAWIKIQVYCNRSSSSSAAAPATDGGGAAAAAAAPATGAASAINAAAAAAPATGAASAINAAAAAVPVTGDGAAAAAAPATDAAAATTAPSTKGGDGGGAAAAAAADFAAALAAAGAADLAAALVAADDEVAAAAATAAAAAALAAADAAAATRKGGGGAASAAPSTKGAAAAAPSTKGAAAAAAAPSTKGAAAAAAAAAAPRRRRGPETPQEKTLASLIHDVGGDKLANEVLKKTTLKRGWGEAPNAFLIRVLNQHLSEIETEQRITAAHWALHAQRIAAAQRQAHP